MSPVLRHPCVLSAGHRALTKLDWSIPKTPLYGVLGNVYVSPYGDGWTAQTVVDGDLCWVRGGGSKDGPQSVSVIGSPGVYVRTPDGRIFEMLAKAEAPTPCSLDNIDLVLFGYTEDEIPGWNGWGDEPVASNGTDTEIEPDPNEDPDGWSEWRAKQMDQGDG